MILESLKSNQHRNSTTRSYYGTWKNFNKFIIKLDRKPKNWEQGVAWYCAYLFHQGCQSSTIRSYISAIKSILIADDYNWSDEEAHFNSIINSCRNINDVMKNRLPIQNGLLDLILFETERRFINQHYLEVTYKAFFSLAHYGMFRVGELAQGTHTLRAKDVHVATNTKKRKMKMILYSSKTHGKNNRPQSVKIEGNVHLTAEKNSKKTCYCPYACLSEFLVLRGDYLELDDQLFVFSDGNTPVKPRHVRKVLKEILKSMGLDNTLYDMHSFRIGRATDMFKFGYPVETIKKWGRWTSNAVYKYLRDI